MSKEERECYQYFSFYELLSNAFPAERQKSIGNLWNTTASYARAIRKAHTKCGINAFRNQTPSLTP